MRLIRALVALALLKEGYWMLDRADDLRACNVGCTNSRVHPAEAILLASLTGLAICIFWIWINGRAWG